MTNRGLREVRRERQRDDSKVAGTLGVRLPPDHEERLGCDGCNDYDLPEWVPSGELVREIAKLNHESEEDAVCSLGFNTSVCGAVASMLGTAAGVSS